MPKYRTLSRINQKTVVPVGTVIELTKKQAESPMYKNRVRPLDVHETTKEPELTPATPKAGTPKPAQQWDTQAKPAANK